MYGASPPPRSAGTAKVLILVGLILQAIEAGILVLLALIVLFAPFLAVFLLPLAVIGIVWLFLVYLFSYDRVNRGDYAGARTPTLVFGILSLVTLNLISGILYIVAYIEIEAAEREQSAIMHGGYPGVAPGWGAPSSSPVPPAAAGPPAKYCPYCGRPNPAVSRFCQGCGAAFP